VGFEDAGDAGDFFKGQQGRAFEELMVAAELLFGHAIHAAEITAVSDGQANVINLAAELVYQSCGGLIHGL
jgi:hypothetical protein